MPSILRSSSASQKNSAQSKFRTVLGLTHLARSSLDRPDDNSATLPLPTPPARRKKLDQNVFQPPSSNDPQSHTDLNLNLDLNLKRPVQSPARRASHDCPPSSSMPAATRPNRVPVAASPDGPWSVSAAETPHDTRSYSIYIKTPTHNITLTRTATEIIDLHDKLRDAVPNAALPKLPIDSVAHPPQKRRSSFLHTLSRFASSSSTSTRSSGKSSAPSSFQSPLTSPSAEIADPFASPLTAPDAHPVTTSLGAYLTTLANDPRVRVCRPWRKFVRVRTDDLESVRVERAIKRVRSDLAAHHAATSAQAPAHSVPSSSSVSIVGSESEAPEPATRAESVGGARTHDGIKEEDEDVNTEEHHAPSSQAAATENASTTGTASEVADEQGDEGHAQAAASPPASPIVAAHPSLRIPRSASADPDKAHRLSRVWNGVPSPLKQTGGDETETDDADAETDRASMGGGGGDVLRKPRKRERKSKKVVIDDFEMIRVLGKGCAGKVLLVRNKMENKVYALKAITKRHVLAHQELQHTLTEQAVLKRMAHEAKDPFVVRLWWSFHDKENLFLVMDFHPGGDLATQLARWGRLGRDRARFYAAELVEGVEGLHAAGVIYRDLKPENILIGADGHIVLTDFGLSKEFPRRSSVVGATALTTAPSTPSRSSNASDYVGSGSASTNGSPTSATAAVPSWMNGNAPGLPNDQTNTFCGTAEYLAPEVIQGLPYSYEVDWWSFGTMLYEMLTGITPFWANNHSDMYVRVLQDELTFPDDRTMDQDTKSLIRGLLQRNPALRMSEPRIKRHPYFSMIDWSHVYYKRYIPPYIPPVDPSNVMDTQNFDDTFLDMEPTVDNDPDEDMPTDEDKDRSADDERTDGEESVKTPPAGAKSPLVAVEDDGTDVFDGYSYKARNSVIMDDDDEEVPATVEDDLPEEDETVDQPLDTPEPESETVSIVEPEGASTPHAQSPQPESAMSEVTTPTTKDQKTLAPPKLGPRTQSTTSSEMDQELRDLMEDTVRLDDSLAEGETTVKASVVPKPPTEAPPSPTRPDKTLAGAKEAKHVHIKGHRKNRTERSGVLALDRNLGDIEDEDESATEREDDDWDFIEMPGGEEVNGQRGTSLFARGVVDRYRLAVFSRKQSPLTSRTTSRAVSGTESDAADSPTRRGRSTGLGLKTKTFLRTKSPPSTFSSSTSRSFSNVGTSTSVSSIGLLTPSPSVPLGHSLRSKPSSTSVTPSSSSDQSANGDPPPVFNQSPSAQRIDRDAVDSSGETPEKPRSKKLKKGAEKVFALFGSPR